MKKLFLSFFLFIILALTGSFFAAVSPVSAQDQAAQEVMQFIRQMTDKTMACAERGISEQNCVCQSVSEWKDMLVLMQMLYRDPHVDDANRAILMQGITNVQSMINNCP